MKENASHKERLFSGAYRGRRVLVTGHTGFKGSWLSIWLHSMGADVIGYSLEPPTDPSLFSAVELEKRITHVTGDIRDIGKVKEVFDRYQPEIVFHLAAQALVRESYFSPKSTFDTNVGGTVNLLEVTRNSSSVKAFINVTSDKCYENREWVWGYRENDPMGGSDPYSASKGCAELVFSSYQKSFFLNSAIGLASVRAGNVIGGGDWAKDRLIPDCVRAVRSGRTIEIRNPDSVRPWQHVLEPLSGYLLLGSLLLKDSESFSGGWNFGPAISNTVDVRHVVGLFIRMWGDGAWLDVSEKNEKKKEAKSLALCCDKANSLLSWHPVLSFEETLNLTVDWYRAFYDRKPVYDTCVRQLDFYIRKAEGKKMNWALKTEN